MIPLSIRLKGFLCYKEEQQISFDGSSTLWMLTGLNGSGKSSIFDAVTYALFGHHRGGGQNAHELINKDSDTMLAEFEFLLDGQPYRIKRTLRRNTRGGATGTQQIFRRESGENGQARWKPVEGTDNRRDGFDPWVRDHLGLTYETFTSSVLLLQGKAEKLLDSKPEGRREVLASIVDLERYERLHRKADDQRKDLDAQLKSLSHRIEALPEVTDEQLAGADLAITRAEEARGASRKEVERLQGLEYQARAWVEVRQQLEQARARWEQAQALLASAPEIEKDLTRLRELREVLPHLQVIVEQRGAMHAADQKARELQQHRQVALEQTAQRESALRQTREKRQTVQGVLGRDEQRHREVGQRLRESAVAMEKLRQLERQEHDLARLRGQLAELPTDLEGQLAAGRREAEELGRLAQLKPHLERLYACRAELRQGVDREQAAEKSQQTIRARGEQLAAEVEQLEPRARAAALALEKAREQATETRTLLQQARDSLRELQSLDGARVCRHCGQPLTEGHLKEERRRREKEVAAVEERHRLSQARVETAREAEQQLREQLQQAEHSRQEARLEYRDAQSHLRQARLDVQRLQDECAASHAALPPEEQAKVAPGKPSGWLETQYPREDDLRQLEARIGRLDRVRQQLREQETRQQTWSRLKGEEASLAQTLERLRAELPADLPRLRQEHEDFKLEEQALQKSLETQRAELKKLEADADRLAREREHHQAQVTRLDGQIREQQLTREHADQTVARTRKLLPPSWLADLDHVGLRSWSEWSQERDRLEAAGVEEKGKALEQARAGLDLLARERDALAGRLEAFPGEARRQPEEVRALLDAARRQDRLCEEELTQARQQRALLEGSRRQREQLGQESAELDRERLHYRLLAELLGRERLQLYLVRQAERQVVDYANAVLDRLSGGQLYLKLSGEANGEGSSAKALELEAYNRSTGEKPINVAFLSGSQKFRVAVSLALGIGQYASRQHRPIESVIIDEGFGCLDRQGRQVMIQELQNLRGQMRCILLVSHQEEFAEAFSDGYHFLLEEGATRVTRIQK